MNVPAGEHVIEFRFAPAEYAIGNTISLVSSVLLLLGLVGAVGYGIRRRPEPAGAPAAPRPAEPVPVTKRK
ncbi:hypothetical protein BH24BAC1_BH24BAC1_33530 [soil metagenome]|jgi:hypothetical protein